MNRGTVTSEMAASIIETYRDIQEKTKNESLAGWYGIYPFIEPHFGNYVVGEYMNGAILPLVGGELCKAAFKFGYEKFAVEQLEILEKIVKASNGRIPGCVNGDGTPQKEAIPDEWGQAAFVSAMVEGLAGVVDKGVQFSEVEISPRWYFAGVEKTSVNIGYGNDGNQVGYTYLFNPKNNRAEIVTTGKFDIFTIRIPIPENSKTVSATMNGKRVQVLTEKVNQSRYAVLKGSGSNNRFEFTFK
jgi:hypothetical protein